MPRTIEERLLSKVNHNPVTGCWEWVGSKMNSPGRYGNYGRIMYEGRVQFAHRVMFRLKRGYAPDVVMHTCDNPCCVNPSHLAPGDNKKNCEDKFKKGRDNRKATFAEYQLTWMLRSQGNSYKRVGAWLGFSPATIRKWDLGLCKHGPR